MSAEIRLFKHLAAHSALWMVNPGQWIWATAAGQAQGPGMVADEDPGLANLIWLALDMEEPPRRYDLRYHNLVHILLMTSNQLTLAGLPLRDQAASLTLTQFHETCAAEPHKPGSIIELLALLSKGRLTHAHT